MSESSNSKYYSPHAHRNRHSAKDTADLSRKETTNTIALPPTNIRSHQLVRRRSRTPPPYTHELTIVSEPSIVFSLTTNQKQHSPTFSTRTSGSTRITQRKTNTISKRHLRRSRKNHGSEVKNYHRGIFTTTIIHSRTRMVLRRNRRLTPIAPSSTSQESKKQEYSLTTSQFSYEK